MPRLDQAEVSALFAVPFAMFIGQHQISEQWRHVGRWIDWLGSQWLFHEFYFETQAIEAMEGQQGSAPKLAVIKSKVWGLTARILVDAAVLGFDRMPEFEHNVSIWDQDQIDKIVAHDARFGDIIGTRSKL